MQLFLGRECVQWPRRSHLNAVCTGWPHCCGKIPERSKNVSSILLCVDESQFNWSRKIFFSTFIRRLLSDEIATTSAGHSRAIRKSLTFVSIWIFELWTHLNVDNSRSHWLIAVNTYVEHMNESKRVRVCVFLNQSLKIHAAVNTKRIQTCVLIHYYYFFFSRKVFDLFIWRDFDEIQYG